MSLTYNPYMYQHHSYLLLQTTKWDASFPTTSEDFYAYGKYQMELFDYAKAFEAFQKAFDLHSKEAIFMLGLCYQKGYGTRNCPVTASVYFKNYFKEAILASIDTSLFTDEQTYHLAMCYRYGLGTEMNLLKAYDLFLKSSDGFALSCYELGNLIQQGYEPLLTDMMQALDYYLQAYKLLYGPSLFSHFKIYQGKTDAYPYLNLLKTEYSYELGRYMRVVKENPSKDSYLRLAAHYELGYPGDTPEGYAVSCRKADKFRNLSNNFN